jgi:hypothetical protein
VDLNLDTLKREILDYLDSTGLAVFHSSPGGLDGQPLVLWDAERHPDYQMFLDVARKCGTQLVVFASREFTTDDLDDLLGHIDELEFDRDQKRDYERRLREMRIHDGVTCSIELGFDYHSRFYVYEVQPDWYDEFLSVEDEILSLIADVDEMEDDEPLGGYFSKN